MINKKPINITELALGGANHSLLAARLRLDDILPLAKKLDQVGYWSVESCDQAVFESCIRYLGESPWDRLRELKKAMPKTKQQMSLHGQSLMGSRHYADDMVESFVECAVANGIDVLRIFDAMNDSRNLRTAVSAAKKQGVHAQGSIIYSASSAAEQVDFVDLAKKVEDLGADSLVINDSSGALNPYKAFELVTALKASLSIPIALHMNAAAGLSSMTLLKAIEAGVDHVDTAISSMSLSHSFSPTESIVSALEGSTQTSVLDLSLLENIADDFSHLRKKYSAFEVPSRNVDPRILRTRLPSDVLSSIMAQLKEQGAADQLNDVISEVLQTQEDLGSIPLIASNVDLVVSQSVQNVLAGKRYKSISKATQSLLKGEYGMAPRSYDKQLESRVLNGDTAMESRPASLLEPEIESLTKDLAVHAKDKGFVLADNAIEDALILGLFPRSGLNFLEHRDNAEAFEPVPQAIAVDDEASNIYSMKLNGKNYIVNVDDDGSVSIDINGHEYTVKVEVGDEANTDSSVSSRSSALSSGEAIAAPLAGNIVKVCVAPGQSVVEGDTLLILEAMKMETEVKAATAATIANIHVKEGDSVSVGDTLITI
ncbi:MAG: oxaloacetate decarboxylase alpha subunit [Candidatus Endobugula sp.]|jgi:oxaloacetate decarboxylase alpha subunit